MRKFSQIILTILIFTFFSNFLFGFGKNKVQYKNFEWYYIQSPHFDIYFYEDAIQLARFTAAVAESAYTALSYDFNYKIGKRIPIILYKSHNDFQQTNVVIQYMEEGIGGVTELLKNRVVLPFEGDYEQFRHVIHHELTHAVMNDMLYGGSLQRAIQSNVAPVPLWVSEGLAEFESEGWNNRLDMAVRDGVINGYLPELKYLQYVSPYQGGASVFRFIAETYGREKIGEFLHRLKGKMQFEDVIQQTFQMKMEEFSERWQRWLKKMYWMDYANRESPKEIATPITDHVKKRNYLNVSPAISPDGQYIAFISDKDGYQNIYLYSTIKEKIVGEVITGTRSESFEELHFLRPGISFSPDGQKLAFTAKSKGKDWIYIKDIKSGNIEKIKIDLDGVYTVSWSPDGNYLAFVGNHAEKSDIFIYDLNQKKYINLTNDIFTDDMPSWSKDGKKIVFVSDRKNFTDPASVPENFEMEKHDYSQRDIYMIDIQSKKIQRITDTPWNENFPIFAANDSRLFYTSDQNGIYNIYTYDLYQKKYWAITDVYTGIYQLSITKDDRTLVFVSFRYGGFDIYTMSQPLTRKLKTPDATYFVRFKEKLKAAIYFSLKNARKEEVTKSNVKRIAETLQKHDYSHFVFKPNMYEAREELEKEKKKSESVALPESKVKTEAGEYYVRKYKIKITPDLVIGQAGYNTFFGVQGYTQFAFSDLMGNYQILLNTNLVYDLRNSDYSLLFANLKSRLDYGFGIFHNADYFLGNYGLQRFRNYGANIFSYYGISRYRRFEGSITWFNVKLEYLDVDLNDQFATTILPQIAYVFDNVLYGYTGPVAGMRYYASVLASPKYAQDSRDFTTFKIDFRKYFMINRDYQFAFRFTSGASIGADPQTFYVGGIDNWINRKFKNGIRIDRIDDIYFADFITPLRGAEYYEREGDRYFLTNIEFRFPMIQYLSFGFPPITFGNIRGVMFTDFGTAWREKDQRKLRLFRSDPLKGLTTQDLVIGYGFGTRIFFFGLLLRIDVAWKYTIDNSSKPLYYFSIGGDI
jgi:Tol biopolymer transport system component